MNRVDLDIEFLKQVAQEDTKFPNHNPWSEVVPLQHVLGILEKYR